MKFEVLISTMFKTNLTFLDEIFLNNQLIDYNILIVNQTNKNQLLYSEFDKIRVVNSFERGTSKSRNLAIENAEGDFCLFADDDTIFEKKFEDIIISEFLLHPDAYLLSFESTSGKKMLPHLNYPKYPGLHNKKTLIKVHMITMAFNKSFLKKSKVRFNEYFTLGGQFSGGTEYVFLRSALAKGLNAYHVKKTIVHHIDEISSGKKMESDAKIHTSAARANHFNSTLYAYLWLFKYLFFLLRNNLINFKQLKPKFRVGAKGIKEYNTLLKQRLIERQN